MSKEIRKIIKKIERENPQKHTVFHKSHNPYDDELDTDCLRLSSHS